MPPAGKIGSADLGSWGLVGENRQRRFFDEHGLDDGLSRPGRKIRPGDTLTKQRWSRHWGSGSPRDSVGRFGSSVCFGSVGLESAEPAKSAKSAVGRIGSKCCLRVWTFYSPGLDGKDCWSRQGGRGSHASKGENRQRRFFDEHGLDDGLSRPCRKIRPGDTLTKQRWFSHGGGSGSPRDSVGRFGSRVCFGSVGLGSAEPAKSAVGSRCWR